jgi:hypothetical protein
MDAPLAEPEHLRRLERASSLALDAGEYADVPDDLLAAVRAVCEALPETVEVAAWAGTQWRVRNRMFAHVLTIDFAMGPVTVLVFRAAEPELGTLRGTGLPYFRPAWGKDAVGMVLDENAGQDDLAELITESYCTLAPKKLVALVDRPPR